jgi:gamma-glutamyl-gamma-aminobutyrate hydrolase PuuD
MREPEKYVLVIGEGGYYYHQPFHKFGRFSRDLELFKTPDKISLVVFTGGADISPSLYGHKPSVGTFCMPHRDVYELLAYRYARKHNLPLAGICRGAQFLCAMAGGTLYQHVTGHSERHTILTWDDRIMYVTSTHHQMQNPPPDAKVLAWSNERRSTVYIGEDDQRVEAPQKEYECVYYPNINAVGMQYHPEAMSEVSPGFQFAGELVDRFLKREKTAEIKVSKV